MQDMEWRKCKISPYYFLKTYGKIRDKDKGVIPWEGWPHLQELLEVLRTYKLIIILKAKQLGITWLMQADNLHMSLFREGANILTLSKGQDEAAEELDYARFIHSQLPDFLRVTKGKDQSSLITFPATHSRMRALPSTPPVHSFNMTEVRCFLARLW